MNLIKIHCCVRLKCFYVVGSDMWLNNTYSEGIGFILLQKWLCKGTTVLRYTCILELFLYFCPVYKCLTATWINNLN
jgi:hypothetical protein